MPQNLLTLVHAPVVPKEIGLEGDERLRSILKDVDRVWWPSRILPEAKQVETIRGLEKKLLDGLKPILSSSKLRYRRGDTYITLSSSYSRTLGIELLRVIFLGHGWSDRQDHFDRSFQDQARMIISSMDALHLDCVTVVGHDTGGSVALILAIEHQLRVNRLVITNSVCYDRFDDNMLDFGHPQLRKITLRNAKAADVLKIYCPEAC